jgi:hypothetical protein
VVGSFGVKEHSSCEVWKNFGDIWWNFGVFSGAKDLFIIIFGNRGSCCNSSNVQGQRHNLQEAQGPKCKIVRNYGSSGFIFQRENSVDWVHDWWTRHGRAAGARWSAVDRVLGLVGAHQRWPGRARKTTRGHRGAH